MSRYHRRYDPKEHEASLAMLRRVAEIRSKAGAPIPLLLDNNEKQDTKEEQKSCFVLRHNAWRERMLLLGWPPKELPDAEAAWKARELLRLTEPYVQIERKEH